MHLELAGHRRRQRAASLFPIELATALAILPFGELAAVLSKVRRLIVRLCLVTLLVVRRAVIHALVSVVPVIRALSFRIGTDFLPVHYDIIKASWRVHVAATHHPWMRVNGLA